MKQVTIVDYGMGNLRSVAKACEACGAQTSLATRPEQVAQAERLVLPGVGSFGDAMRALDRQGLVEPLRAYLDSGRPFLGICLGLHLLFESGDEGGGTEGLGLLKGRVVRFSEPAARGAQAERLPIPHMGWNTVHFSQPDDPLLAGIDDGAYLYFLHSYYVLPADAVALTETPYPENFCSSISVGSIRATQFHPEKSQALGLRILRNYLQIKPQ